MILSIGFDLDKKRDAEKAKKLFGFNQMHEIKVISPPTKTKAKGKPGRKRKPGRPKGSGKKGKGVLTAAVKKAVNKTKQKLKDGYDYYIG